MQLKGYIRNLRITTLVSKVRNVIFKSRYKRVYIVYLSVAQTNLNSLISWLYELASLDPVFSWTCLIISHSVFYDLLPDFFPSIMWWNSGTTWTRCTSKHKSVCISFSHAPQLMQVISLRFDWLRLILHFWVKFQAPLTQSPWFKEHKLVSVSKRSHHVHVVVQFWLLVPYYLFSNWYTVVWTGTKYFELVQF